MLLKTFVFILSSPDVPVELRLVSAGITDCPVRRLLKFWGRSSFHPSSLWRMRGTFLLSFGPREHSILGHAGLLHFFPCDTCLCTEWPLLPVPVLIILKDSASFFVGLLSRKRGLIGFFVMIKCKASRNPFDFNNYGCWCGLGGKGKPLDEVDR